MLVRVLLHKLLEFPKAIVNGLVLLLLPLIEFTAVALQLHSVILQFLEGLPKILGREVILLSCQLGLVRLHGTFGHFDAEYGRRILIHRHEVT